MDRHDQAAAALDALGGLDAAISGEAATAVETPAEAATPQSQVETPTVATTETPVEDSEFARTDLEALLDGVEDDETRERIERAYKTFQGAATRRFQDAAELRKQYEPLGPVEELQQAIALREWLQNPVNWSGLHAELSEALGVGGNTEPEANEPELPQLPDISSLAEDEELAPVVQYARGLEQRLQMMQSQLDADRSALEEERAQMAFWGEMERQEQAIRQANPTYDQTDIDAIHEIASFYDGSLIEAQKRYTAIQQTTLERYLASKGATSASHAARPVSGGGTVAQKPKAIRSMDDALAATLEAARNLETVG